MSDLSRIKKIAVIGMGTMGPGISQAFAQGGYTVTGFDLNKANYEKSDQIIRAGLGSLAGFGSLTKEQAGQAADRLSYAESLGEAVAGAQIVIESVNENREVKREVYAQIAQHASPEAVIWSNTSTLNIYELVPEDYLGRAIIAHWFAPPHIIPLIEVVKGEATPPELVDSTVELLRGLGKVPVVIEKYVPGFIINRLQRIIGREVLFLLEQGLIKAEDLDLAVKASLAPRMMLLGVVQRYDFTGLELSARNLLDEEFFDPPTDNRPKELHDRIARGETGVTSGKGFYDYTDRDLAETLRNRDQYLMRIMQGVGFCLEKKRLV